MGDGCLFPLEMRRQLNGKYRAYMHEEITQALFLHYIGIRWAVCFRRIFRGVGFFLDNKKGLSKLQEGRRDYFLKQSSGISYQLKGDWRSQYFMQQLPETEQQGTQGYGEDDLADEADQTAKSPLAVKQGLLHLLYTDADHSRRLRTRSGLPSERLQMVWPIAVARCDLHHFGLLRRLRNLDRLLSEIPTSTIAVH